MQNLPDLGSHDKVKGTHLQKSSGQMTGRQFGTSRCIRKWREVSAKRCSWRTSPAQAQIVLLLHGAEMFIREKPTMSQQLQKGPLLYSKADRGREAAGTLGNSPARTAVWMSPWDLLLWRGQFWGEVCSLNVCLLSALISIADMGSMSGNVGGGWGVESLWHTHSPSGLDSGNTERCKGFSHAPLSSSLG